MNRYLVEGNGDPVEVLANTAEEALYMVVDFAPVAIVAEVGCEETFFTLATGDEASVVLLGKGLEPALAKAA